MDLTVRFLRICYPLDANRARDFGGVVLLFLFFIFPTTSVNLLRDCALWELFTAHDLRRVLWK